MQKYLCNVEGSICGAVIRNILSFGGLNIIEDQMNEGDYDERFEIFMWRDC